MAAHTPPSPRPKRVVVLGTSGAGKSTLASRLADVLGIEHIELDAFHHGPNWRPRSLDDFAANVADVLDRPSWVADGNYISRVKDTLWPQADLVVWLDLPLRVIVPRIIRRTARRIRSRTELWAGNRERWSALYGRDSLLVWAVQSHRRHRRELPTMLADLQRKGTQVFRLTSSQAADQWLAHWTPSS